MSIEYRVVSTEYRVVSIAYGTALRDIVGEEVAATLRTSEIRLGGSFFV